MVLHDVEGLVESVYSNQRNLLNPERKLHRGFKHRNVMIQCTGLRDLTEVPQGKTGYGNTASSQGSQGGMEDISAVVGVSTHTASPPF